MTRGEAYLAYSTNCDNYWDYEKLIDKIYDSFDEEINALYKAVDNIHSALPPTTLEEARERINEVLLDKSELFLKAWVQQYKLPPSACILHTKVNGGTITSWVEPK